MVLMRDGKRDLSSMFHWLDIRSNTFNEDKLDRKKVKELQGTHASQRCKQAFEHAAGDHNGSAAADRGELYWPVDGQGRQRAQVLRSRTQRVPRKRDDSDRRTFGFQIFPNTLVNSNRPDLFV
ncbi:hypothetical protein CRENBAI_016255 [Crenichthys baileyi]|uniref:Uncharacterized protein n=1 Tax=Crenichthys baileyi TaxID=28760 RepID=A0AAV9S4C5_9TELE